jgi:AraC-like DNA-binding protein
MGTLFVRCVRECTVRALRVCCATRAAKVETVVANRYISRMAHFPSASADALVAAFEQLGLDVAALRRDALLSSPLGAVLAQDAWARLWECAYRQRPDPLLPVRAGLALPFGAFGMIDYLVGSAASVDGAVESLATYFTSIAAGFSLELVRPDANRLVITVVVRPGEVGSPLDTEAFTAAVIIGRLRYIAPQVVFSDVALKLSSADVCEVLSAPVRWSSASTSLELPASSLSLSLRTSDAGLHKTMTHLAAQLGLGVAASSIELAVRARLRALLPEGRAEAANVAQSLGMSERTFHRKLAAEKRSYQDILDDFRAAESERLLRAGHESAPSIAALLGFSEPSAWARAFRRWRGLSPTEWLESNARRG